MRSPFEVSGVEWDEDFKWWRDSSPGASILVSHNSTFPARGKDVTLVILHLYSIKSRLTGRYFSITVCDTSKRILIHKSLYVYPDLTMKNCFHWTLNFCSSPFSHKLLPTIHWRGERYKMPVYPTDLSCTSWSGTTHSVHHCFNNPDLESWAHQKLTPRYLDIRSTRYMLLIVFPCNCPFKFTEI